MLLLPPYSRAPDMIKHLCIALASVLTAYTVSAVNEYEDFKKSLTVFLITYAVLFLIEKLMKEGRRVGVYPINEGSWIDVGNWDEYLKFVKDNGEK